MLLHYYNCFAVGFEKYHLSLFYFNIFLANDFLRFYSKDEIHFEEAKKIGRKLGIKLDKYNIAQLRMGLDAELVHVTRDYLKNITDDD